MIRTLYVVLLYCLPVTASASDRFSELFTQMMQAPDASVWSTPGRAPCREAEDCTHQWALTQAEVYGFFPEEVVAMLRTEIEENPNGAYAEVCNGDEIFNTGYATEADKKVPVFIPQQTVAFHASLPDCQGGHGWVVALDGRFYHFMQASVCGNWIGKISREGLPERKQLLYASVVPTYEGFFGPPKQLPPPVVVSSIAAVPVPASGWLFGSLLLLGGFIPRWKRGT